MPYQVSLKSIMTTEPLFVRQSHKFFDVARKLSEKKSSCAIVLKKNEPIGIVTEKDIVKTLAEHTTEETLSKVTVKQLMTSPVMTLHENCKFVEGLILSRSRKIRHIPIVDDNNHCTGIISFHDLNNAYIHMIEELHELIENSVESRTQELENANKQLEALSLEDPMLGVGNRRSMKVDLKHTDAAFQRYKTPYSVALIDLDHFKKYNDTYGHPEADKILKKVSQYLQDHVRGADRIYRYGGEEFLILMPETLSSGAEVIVGRLIEGIRALKIPHKSSPMKMITVSGGFCSTDLTQKIGHELSSKEMVQFADKCLYQAKQKGRACYASFDEISEFHQTAPTKNTAPGIKKKPPAHKKIA